MATYRSLFQACRVFSFVDFPPTSTGIAPRSPLGPEFGEVSPARGELADLCASLVRPGLFAAALARSMGHGVGIDEALIGLGATDERTLYRAVADRLGMPFVTEGLGARAGRGSELAARSGILALAAGGKGRFALAPRGEALAGLLSRPLGALASSCVVTTPKAMSAAARAADARGIARRAAKTRPDSGPGQANAGAARWQIALAAMALLFGPSVALTWPGPTFTVVKWAGWALFGLGGALRIAAMIALARSVPTRPARPLKRLPRYGVLVPLRAEGKVVRKLVAAIRALDYPAELLDVKLLVERDDVDTRLALSKLRLPDHMEVFLVPDGVPRTKPRALCAALPYVHGEYVVVFDAEDEPEPKQLKEAAALFAERPDSASTTLFLVAKGPHRGQPLTPAGLRTVFRYHRSLAGGPAGHPHALRHSFGTALAEAGVDLAVLQTLMGHDRVDSSAILVK